MKVICKVQQSTIEQLRSWCQERIADMKRDVSSYAPGRQRLWLFAECNLKTGIISPSYFDERIWNFSQRVFPGCDIGLLTYNGTIQWHRDHNYATTIARGVNLGEATFGIEEKGKRQLHQLTDGLIYEFNCKVPHAVLNHSNERFSLVFWKMRERYRQQFERNYPF